MALAITVAHHLGLNSSLAPEDLSRVAQHLVMGDLQQTGQIPLETLRTAYTAGFNTLLQLLALFTALTAVIVYLFLGRQQPEPRKDCVTMNPAP